MKFPLFGARFCIEHTKERGFSRGPREAIDGELINFNYRDDLTIREFFRLRRVISVVLPFYRKEVHPLFSLPNPEDGILPVHVPREYRGEAASMRSSVRAPRPR